MGGQSPASTAQAQLDYSADTVSAGRWYTLIAWHDSVNDTLNFQVNDGTVSSLAYTGGAMDTTYPLTIGAHADGTSGLNGRLGEVALYKRILTGYDRFQPGQSTDLE